MNDEDMQLAIETGEEPDLPDDFRDFQRIRLKYINEMLAQLNQDATGIHLLMAEKKSIEEFLGEPA